MPLATTNHATESNKAAMTETPATILDFLETPGRRISRTWPTIKTTQTIPITANVMSHGALGGCGASEGKSGNRLLNQGSSQIFSTVMANNAALNSQVRLSVSDFRMGGWKLVEAMCSLCAIGDAQTVMQVGPRLQLNIKYREWDFQQY